MPTAMMPKPEVYKVNYNGDMPISLTKQQSDIDKNIIDVEKKILLLSNALRDLKLLKKRLQEEQIVLWQELYSDNHDWFSLVKRLEEENK